MPISITSSTPYTQNFDTLTQSTTASTWTNDSTLQGWYLFNGANTAITTYVAGTGSGNGGSFYSFGGTGATDRALGGLGSGGAYFGAPSNNAVAGWIAVAATNDTGATINSITLSFNGEEWRNGGNTTAQKMVLQYGFGSSFASVATWNTPGGNYDWTSPVATNTAAAVDGNNAGLVTGLGGTLTNFNWTSGSTLWVRWVDINDAGNDHGLAIDNFSLTANLTATLPNVNLSVDKTAGSEAGTTVITVTATASGAVSGDQTMHLGVSGTGITVGDYTLSSDTITILSGQTKGSVTFTVADDTLAEGPETAVLTLSNPSSGVTLGTTVTQNIAIADDDAAQVNLDVSSHAGSEAGTTVITVTATASKGVVGDQTVQLGVSGAGITSDDYTLSASTITIADGATQGSVTFTVKDDAVAEGTETAVLTISNPSSGVQLGNTTTQNIAITDNDVLHIAQIQGTSHISPFNGKNVFDVAGIVTMVASNGFYMQDPTPDANPATSEAIFVFTSSTPTQHVGDAVKVSGLVQEFRPSNSADNLTVTEITAPVVTAWTDAPAGGIAPTVIGVDRTPPTSAISTDGTVNVETGGTFNPATDGIDFWESLEGMLVSVQNPVAVSPTIYSATNTDGELYVLANNGAGATGVTDRGGVVISATDMNPERIQIDGLKSGIAMPDVDVGAKLSDITGVISYFGNNFELLVPSSPTIVQASTNPREVTTVTHSANELTVATFNVENLDPNDGAAKFNALAEAIAHNLMSPDILSVEEIQDNNGATNNGVVAADVTIGMLIQAIIDAGGPHYEYRQIDPVNGTNGGEGGGNIRVAFLYNPERVSFVEGSLTLIDPTNAAFSGSRKPLVGTFTFNGENVTVIGNHFASKGGDDPLYGPTQPPVLSSEVQRDQQATIVANYVKGLEATNPNAKILVMGDLNDFQFSQPLNILQNGTHLNTLISTLPANEQYTYNYQGNAQAIDHIMASDTLMGSLTGFDVVHINSEFEEQVSDHDPLVARFLIEPAGQTINGTTGRDTLVGTAGKDTITGGRGIDTLTGGASADKFVYTSVLDAGDTITDFTPGSDSLVITALLASVGYAGTNPVADGYLKTVVNGANTTVYFDSDGSAGAGAARALVVLTGAVVSNAAVLLDPSLYHPAV